MSINKLLFEEEKRNEYVKESGSALKQVIGIGGLAAVFGTAMSKKGSNQYKRTRSGKIGTKLGEAGVALKSSIDDAFTKRTTRDLSSANSFFDDLIENSSSILRRTVEGALENTPELDSEVKMMQKAISNEKTFLLTAVRDAVRDLNITGEAGTTNMLVQKIEGILDGEMRNADRLSEEVENVLRSIRNNSTNDKKIQQFKKFKALKENSRYFSGRSKATGVAEKMISKNRKEFSQLSQAFKGSFAISQGLDINAVDIDDVKINSSSSGYFKQLEKDFDSFSNQLRELGGTVSRFTVVKEHEKELGSIYMHIAGRNNKEINYKVGLHYSGVHTDRGNLRKVIRGTSTLNTPFVIPSFMPHITDIQNLLREDSSVGDLSNVMRRSTPERFVRNTFLDFVQKNGGLIDDLSSRQINKFADMVRAQAISINRASLFSQTNNPLGQSLSNNLAVQQTLSSYQGIIYGAESLSQKEAQMIPIKMMEKFGDYIDAPASSQAPLRKAMLPNVGEVRGINFNLLKLNDLSTITPFTLLRGFGFKDRGTSPLTARESQFFGREDFISNLVAPGEKRAAEGGRGQFGKSYINIIASNANLLSVDPAMAEVLEAADRSKLGRVQGANMAGILMFGENQAMKAGLGEGMAYYGGSVEVDIPIQKSVLDPDQMKQPEFAFLRNLIEKRNRGETKVDSYKYKGEKLAKVFQAYGDERGQIPLGMIDNRISAIKNLKGLQEFSLQIDPLEGVLDDKGRIKYSLTGKMRVRSDINKLFGIMGRVTSYGDPITKQAAIDILGQSFSDKHGSKAKTIAEDIFKIYETGFAGKMSNLMITSSSSGLDKSVDFIQNFMYGGYRMLGGTDEGLLKSGLLSRKDLENISKLIEGDKFVKSEKQMARAKLVNFTQAIIKGLAASGRSPSTSEMGLLLAPIKHLEGSTKFGLQAGDLEEQVFKKLNIAYDKEAYGKIFSTGLAIGATSMFSGSPAEVLGRNMAKFEPRHANILMYGMRSFFGLNTEQSVKYLNDFILRQEGIEYSGKYLPDITSFGMSFKSKMAKSIDDKALNIITPEIFEKLSEDARTIGKVDPTKADQFRQSLVNALDRDAPSVLRIGDVVKDEGALSKLSKIIPSGQIIIPSGETIEGMVNYQIQKGDKVENIDARLVSNLKGIFDNLSQLDYDPRSAARLNALSTIKDDVLDMTSTALRRSLSGRVTGSVTMQGSAMVIGDGMESKYLSDIELKSVRKIMGKEKGFSVFTNVGGFMDSLNTFMGAATKTKARSEQDALTKTIGKYKDFMFGHMSGADAVRGVLFRNPSMSVTHLMPGIALSRFDIGNVQDITKTLDQKNIGFLTSMIQDDVLQDLGKSKELSTILKDTSVSDGVRKFNRITPENVFRLENLLKKNPEIATKLSGAQAGAHFADFQKNIRSFYGNNVPVGLSAFTATPEGVESAIATLKEKDYRGNKHLSNAMGSLRGMKSALSKPERVAAGSFNNVYKSIIENYGKSFGVGGGTMMFPTFTADIQLSGREKALSTRLDLSYSMIGDFDADIYQFFHETKDISSKALAKSGDKIRSNIVEASAKFSIIRNLTDEAYNALGRSLGSDEMALAAFKADQAKKEIILKNVGGVDVQFKSMLLGMIENSLSATPDDKGVLAQAAQMAEHIADTYHAGIIDTYHGALAAGSTQDIGVIKAKKLPFAVEIGEILGGAMRRGLETGNTEDFEKAYRQLILNNSEDLTRGFDISDVKLQGATEELDAFYKQALQGKRIAPGERMLAAMSAAIKTAHREQLYHMGSETKLTKAMNQYGSKNKGMFEVGVAKRNALEMGLLGEGSDFKQGASALEKMEYILDNVSDNISRTRTSMLKGISGKGMAGLIGFGLVSSYGLGASYSTSALSGPDKFSDMKVKEQIGQRAIYNNMSYQHKDIAAKSMRPPENFYQRQINQKEMYINKPSSIAITGNASNINDAQKVLQRITAMGGKGHLSIQDNVLPRPNLADYYMRDK